ncbi:MAG: hypothetical protein ACRCTJ_04585 [Brevinema sp.]
MITFFLAVFFFFNFPVFAQFTVNNPNITSYIDDDRLGLQVNPSITGTRSSRPNQEFDLNLALFYQEKYLIKDQEIIGRLNGRLITETPLSSYDILEEIHSNEQINLSNFAQELPEFQKMLQQYQLLLGITNNLSTTNDIEKTNESSIETNVSNEYELYDPYTDYQDNINPATPIIQNSKTNLRPKENIEEYEYSFLNFSPQKMVAQSIEPISNIISIYDITQFLEKHYTNSTFEKKDLEFLIHYEKIKESYRTILSQYNSYLSNEATNYKSSFDPYDTNEIFTLLFIGDQTQHMFSQRFHLDDKKNYQSHNNIVWYLGYSLPLYKKDVDTLYKLFQNNDSITYYIKGKKGQIEFTLNKQVIRAMRQLLELYARGAFIQSAENNFPILRND